jgi:hypothetical protein
MKDFIDRLTSYKTTVIGVVTAVLAIAVLFGWIGAEKQPEIATGINNFWDALIAVLASINGLILVFTKETPIE